MNKKRWQIIFSFSQHISHLVTFRGVGSGAFLEYRNDGSMYERLKLGGNEKL